MGVRRAKLGRKIFCWSDEAKRSASYVLCEKVSILRLVVDSLQFKEDPPIQELFHGLTHSVVVV